MREEKSIHTPDSLLRLNESPSVHSWLRATEVESKQSQPEFKGSIFFLSVWSDCLSIHEG